MSTVIAVGSESQIKIDAVADACRAVRFDVEIIPNDVDSGVSAQPVGCDEMIRGAKNRAQRALAAHPGSVAIGIECGIIPCGRMWYDQAVIAIICRDGEELQAKSELAQVPTWAVEGARERGFGTTTVVQILAEAWSCGADDPLGYLTRSREFRKTIITRALIPLLQRIACGYHD